jgi:lipopolysaccharide biosynthesis protein
MRLLVHLHLHYYDQTDYFIGKLSSITGCSWDLYITEVCHDPVIEKKFSTLGANVIYIETEDRGYDIWPFIKVMKSVDLGEYDLVMKEEQERQDERAENAGIRMEGRTGGFHAQGQVKIHLHPQAFQQPPGHWTCMQQLVL